LHRAGWKLGWTPLDYSAKRPTWVVNGVTAPDGTFYEHPGSAAATLLGLDAQEASHLFHADNTIESLRYQVEVIVEQRGEEGTW
jgi:hypothetical protein